MSTQGSCRNWEGSWSLRYDVLTHCYIYIYIYLYLYMCRSSSSRFYTLLAVR